MTKKNIQNDITNPGINQDSFLFLNDKELDKNLFALTSLLEFEKSLYSSKLQIRNVIDLTMYAIMGQTLAKWSTLILNTGEKKIKFQISSHET